jgi:hypothetical protein
VRAAGDRRNDRRRDRSTRSLAADVQVVNVRNIVEQHLVPKSG